MIAVFMQAVSIHLNQNRQFFENNQSPCRRRAEFDSFVKEFTNGVLPSSLEFLI